MSKKNISDNKFDLSDDEKLNEDEKKKKDVLNSLSDLSDILSHRKSTLIVISILILLIIAVDVYLMLKVVPAGWRGINVVILLWLLFAILIYAFYYVVGAFRRICIAKQKIVFLITRVKMDSDKDLIIAYRLDRELRMIYRILES